MMNIFVIDSDPIRAAKLLADSNVRRTPLDVAKILCTTSHIFGVKAHYEPTNVHRKCVQWPILSLGNWQWLVNHGLELCIEHERRFGGAHKSIKVIEWCADRGGRPGMQGTGITPFAVDIPKKYNNGDAVGSYRKYYVHTSRDPEWTYPGVRPIWWSSYATPTAGSDVWLQPR